MKEVIDVGLPPLAQPFSWAVKAGGLLFTTHGPVRSDGSIDLGSIEQQARLTLDNLRRAVHAAGAQMSDVAQVLVYLTEATDMAPVDAVYRAINRIVRVPNELIEISLQSVTEGTDAQAAITIRVRAGEEIFTGHAAHTDIIVAATKAYLNALNKLLGKFPGRRENAVAESRVVANV